MSLETSPGQGVKEKEWNYNESGYKTGGRVGEKLVGLKRKNANTSGELKRNETK